MAFLFTSGQAGVSHEDPADKQGCTLLDKNQPSHFISYESKLESTIRLRLRNNTSCSIVVETDDRYPTQLKRLPQGGARIEAVLEPKDGLRLPLHYLVQDRRRSSSVRRAYKWGDSVFTYEIPPGQSILFDVPASHWGRLDIAVPFSYEWEGRNPIATGVGGVAHRVYFLFDSLPLDWRSIVPLKTTRTEVEALLGQSGDTYFAVYELKEGTVSIEYSSGPCRPDRKGGWNVPENVVVSVSFSSSKKQRLSDLKLDRKKFERVVDRHVGGITYYVNKEERIVYEIQHGEVMSVEYGPPRKYDHLHCSE